MSDKYNFVIDKELVKNEGESLGYDLADDEVEEIFEEIYMRWEGFVQDCISHVIKSDKDAESENISGNA